MCSTTYNGDGSVIESVVLLTINIAEEWIQRSTPLKYNMIQS